MWISLTTILLLAVCPLTFSCESHETIDTSDAEQKQLKDDRKMESESLEDSAEQKQLKNSFIHDRKMESESLEEESEESAEQPWLNAELNLKWRKILHRIKHVTGKVIESAAESAAGKAIAGAILS